MVTTGSSLSGAEIPQGIRSLTKEEKRAAMKKAYFKFDKKKKKEDKEVNETIAYVKFNYENHKNDASPRVKVLDFEYKGQEHQKSYGERKDLLGWNINYFKNKKYARRALDDITSFAKLLSADNDEVYRRIKYFYPKQAKYLRRYQRKHINRLKHKKRLFWRKSEYSKLEKFNKEAF